MSEDKCDKAAPTLESCIDDLKRFHEDLKEVCIGADLDFQVERLDNIIGDFVTTQTTIHGGGTGND